VKKYTIEVTTIGGTRFLLTEQNHANALSIQNALDQRAPGSMMFKEPKTGATFKIPWVSIDHLMLIELEGELGEAEVSVNAPTNLADSAHSVLTEQMQQVVVTVPLGE
jgi:hypothetical protein